MKEKRNIKAKDLRPGACFLDVINKVVWFIVSVERRDMSTLADVGVIRLYKGQVKHVQWLMRKEDVQFQGRNWIRIHE